jgi:hypothetical protein
MTACCQENTQMRAPGVFYEMLICLHGHQPIRKHSARRWQRVPPPSVTGNDLRLSSGPAFLAGFSFGVRPRARPVPFNNRRRKNRRRKSRSAVLDRCSRGLASLRRSKSFEQQGSVRKRCSTRRSLRPLPGNLSHPDRENIVLPPCDAHRRDPPATLTRINLFDGRRQDSFSNYADKQCRRHADAPTRIPRKGILPLERIQGDEQ